MTQHREPLLDETGPARNPDPDRPGTVWVLTTGEAGMRSQVIGLAEAIGRPFTEKQVSLRAPWSWLPGHLCPFALAGLDPSQDRLTPPWPDLLISCGRRSTAASIAVRRLSGGRTMTVHIQHPHTPTSAFDLILPMRHDGLAGSNVFAIDTALHRISPALLARADTAWRQRLKREPQQSLLGIVLGGANRHYRFSDDVLARLTGVIEEARHRGNRVFVTPSRRTGDAVGDLLRAQFGADSGFAYWDGTGDNPYAGLLAVADRLVVTGESVSMVSEALATAHPVHILRLEGHGKRHEQFLSNLITRQMVDPIAGSTLDWSWGGGPASDATPVAAGEVVQRLAERHGRQA